jgi:nucleotide-binding universal stress UspA family protein
VTSAAGEQLPHERTDVIVRSDSAAAAIAIVLEHQRAELLVIGASRWFFLERLLIGSVADRLLRAAECDLLVIPYSATVATSDRYMKGKVRAPSVIA